MIDLPSMFEQMHVCLTTSAGELNHGFTSLVIVVVLFFFRSELCRLRSAMETGTDGVSRALPNHTVVLRD